VGTVYGNVMSFVSVPLAIGQSYQGGIIGYLLQPGDPGYVSGEIHGLIAASSDLGIASWSSTWATYMVGGTSIYFGTGAANTNQIVSVLGTGYYGPYAAKMCYDLVLNGYSDWFLPSLHELLRLYPNRNQIGGFGLNYYLTSCEQMAGDAYIVSFFDGIYTWGSKSTPYSVRAVRSF
jgi:hypothetical protein